MEFHGYFRSSSAYRCRIAFNLLGLDTNFHSVHLRKGGGEQKTERYRAINPQKLVPSLVAEGETFTQSLAIIEWLDETYPGKQLLPQDRNARAHVRAFAEAIACEIHPLQNLRVLDFLKSDLGLDEAQVSTWVRHWIRDGLEACEALATRHASGTYTFGDAPTLADICLIPQLFSADRFGVPLDDMPRLRAIRAICDTNPAFAAAHPSKQPDAE